METDIVKFSKTRAKFSITVTNDDLQIEHELEKINFVSDRSESLSADYKPSTPRVSLESNHQKSKLNSQEIYRFIRNTEDKGEKLTVDKRKIPKLNRSAIAPLNLKPHNKNNKKKEKKNICSASCIII